MFLFTVPFQQNYIRNKQSIRTVLTRIDLFNCLSTRKKQRVTVPICKREMHGVSIYLLADTFFSLFWGGEEKFEEKKHNLYWKLYRNQLSKI